MKFGAFVLAALSLVVLGFALRGGRTTLIFLPGTQVGTVAAANDAGICAQCHASSDSGAHPVQIATSWQGSMMAQAARDPVFYAALAVANKYNSVTGQASGEYCIRCHSPSGWLAGHSEDYTGRSLAGTDLDGVQCDYCHRSIDPLNPDTSAPQLTYPVPGYGNGMHVVQKYADPKRGPYTNAMAPHPTLYDAHVKTSEFCAVCHDVSNVFYAADRLDQPPDQYAPLERTYSEWRESWYATRGDSGTCQSCHMTDTTGYACVYGIAPLRNDVARHDLTGGNTFVPDILRDFWTGLDSTNLANGKLRAEATLRRSADASVAAYRSGDTVRATVRVTNLTGHKLPTGYPEGRRMWIMVTGTDAQGDTVFRSGAYRADSAILVRDAQVKVYEEILGLTPARASAYGLQPGASFHFVLNDTILFDNRIPPRGFTNAAFTKHLAQPVGASYPDGQNFDETIYLLPSTTVTVSASLMYQTISKEYVDFLRDQNTGNVMDWRSWGDSLHLAWEHHGMSEPQVMASVSAGVRDTATSVDGHTASTPKGFSLSQNYPNPFNPTTEFQIVVGSDVGGKGVSTVRIYDVLGREAATLFNGKLNPGTYHFAWDGGGFPSGLYIVRLQAGTLSVERKMLLIR